jgi:hypothetical protein
MNVLFLITSVVRLKNEEISVFSPGERFEQTVHTILTIKQKLPLAQIVVLEASFGDKTLVVFNNVFMYYIDHTGDDDDINEAKMLPTFVASTCYKNLTRSTDYMVCNLSGRYYLDDDFDIRKFNKHKINVSSSMISSGFYTFPSKKIVFFSDLVDESDDGVINKVHVMGVSGFRNNGEFVKY